MKIWFNKISESRRSMVEVAGSRVTIGRDPACDVCLQSPLVSRQHAVVQISDEQLELENVGLNSCVVGDEEVLGGQTAAFAAGTKVRIWPFTLTFEAEKTAVVTRDELEAHLRSIMAELELKIHRKLLERLDLYEFEINRGSDTESILLLENNIEDVCREMDVFGQDNEPLLEEITGLTLRDLLVNQMIMETGTEEYFDLAVLTSNEFDVPATLVPERESELHGLLQFVRERLNLAECRDISQKISRVEKGFVDIFHLVRPHLHNELRKYLILRTLKKDLKWSRSCRLEYVTTVWCTSILLKCVFRRSRSRGVLMSIPDYWRKSSFQRPRIDPLQRTKAVIRSNTCNVKAGECM